MASSLISSSHHIDFDSVFGIDDAGLVQMFESLIVTGLKEFLGCPAVIYEAALIEFFANGSVRDGLVVSTIKGRAVEISEEVFAATFELSTEGLTDFSEVPKDLVFDAWILFSISKEQVSISCLKKELKIEYRLLHDILAKSIYVKAGSFDAVTRERFMLMTAITFDVNWSRLLFDVLKDMVTPGSRQAKGYAIQICVLLKNIPGLELGESRAFPVPRVLNEKMVHWYVVINEKIGGAEIPDSPKLKKTPAKKAVSQRPAVDTTMAPVVKKRRTTKGKPVAKDTVDAPVEQPPASKRKIHKRKRRLVLEIDDEINVEKQPAVALDEQVGDPADETVFVEPVVEKSPTDDPDAIIEQVLDQLDPVATTDDEDMEQVFTEIDTVERTVGTDAEVGTVSSGAVVGNEQLQLVEEADEEMSGDNSQHVQLPSSLVFESPTVQIEQSAAFADTDDQMDIDLSDDSSLHFDDNDAAASISLPAAPIPDDRVLGALRKDSNDQRSLTSLEIKSSHKQLSTQIVTTALDVVDVRRVVRENHQELNAKITSLEEQVAATRHDLLEFSAQAQQTLNVITDT
ncbi:hypothetical protein F511_33726 [Dorcoceras hygrometricum]|uniref:Dystroglycan-like n=1 Tax=Dorcoceras hygrometricum TaxID=472368 RepID=A0A2Z7BWQ6_9LAMI|nr:hypothetical protein F511_33726 [Dorcoceras hygrometricum]